MPPESPNHYPYRHVSYRRDKMESDKSQDFSLCHTKESFHNVKDFLPAR